MTPEPDRRAHLRAAILAVVIAVNGWVAIPIGPRITEKDLAKADAKEQVDEWMGLLDRVGVTRAQFETFVVKGSGFFVDLDNTVSKPIRPVNQLFRTNQSWALFTGADRTPMRFAVRGYTADGTERLLFRRLDPDATFLGGVLNFRRVRGIYDIDKEDLPKRYKVLTRWIATRAFEEHPDLVAVEVLQEEQRTPLPGQAADPAVKLRHRMKVTREDLMAPHKRVKPLPGADAVAPHAPGDNPPQGHGGATP